MKAKLVLVFASSLILLAAVFVLAEVPSTMSYQGRLTDDTGQPVTDSSYSFVFTIYDSVAAGTALWSEGQTVSTQDGLFAVELGSVNPLPETLFQSSPRYLGIAVNGDPEQSPRNPLTTAPYAFQAAIAPAAAGQGPDTNWVCPYYRAFKSGSFIFASSWIYFCNQNNQSSNLVLTFYSQTGVQLDQCTFIIPAHYISGWVSEFAGSCPNAAPEGVDQAGWISIHSDIPISPWGYYVSNPYVPGEPVFAVPLSFYAP